MQACTDAFVAVKHESLTYAVSKARCLLAVISPGFIVDEYCRFGFQNTVRDAEVDVIYVLYGDITSPDDDRLLAALSDEVCIALRNSRRRFVAPLNDHDFTNGDAETRRRKADQFFVRVCLAIPNRREGQERKPLLA